MASAESRILVNIGLGNDMLPESTKPLSYQYCNFSIEENSFENIVLKFLAILFGPSCVNPWIQVHGL